MYDECAKIETKNVKYFYFPIPKLHRTIFSYESVWLGE